jgi:hypothetical protein
MRMYRFHDRRRVMRAGDGKDRGMDVLDDVFFHPEASGNDYLAVLGERFADRVERFLHRGVDEAAGVDDDQIGAVVGLRGGVALGAQLRQDALGVDERLRTA